MHLFRKTNSLENKISLDNISSKSKLKKLLKNPKFYVAIVAWNIVYYTAKCSLIGYGLKVGYDKFHENNNPTNSNITASF
jgi:ABC-type uncharacterized transport system permease subunit